MKRLLLVLGLMTGSVLATTEPIGKWEAKELTGYSFELVSKTAIEHFSFAEQGVVLAELGSKDRGVCGPAGSWKITPEGFLQIQFGPDIAIVMKKIRADVVRYAVQYQVEENGVKKVYSRTKLKLPETAGSGS